MIVALDTIKKYEDRLTTVVGLVATIANIDSRQNAYDEIVLKICEHLLYLKGDVTYDDDDVPDNDYELERLAAFCYLLGNSLRERYEGGDKAVQVKTFTYCWVTGVAIHSEIPDEEGRQRMIHMIRRYRSDYVAPESYELKIRKIKRCRRAETIRKAVTRIKKIVVRIMFTLIAGGLIIGAVFWLFHWFIALVIVFALSSLAPLVIDWWFDE